LNNLDHSSATLNTLRESFEDRFENILDFTGRNSEHGYAYIETERAWQAYRAAHISAVKQCAEICLRLGCAEIRLRQADGTDNGWQGSKAIACEGAILALLPKENSDE